MQTSVVSVIILSKGIVRQKRKPPQNKQLPPTRIKTKLQGEKKYLQALICFDTKLLQSSSSLRGRSFSFLFFVQCQIVGSYSYYYNKSFQSISLAQQTTILNFIWSKPFADDVQPPKTERPW
jgi:hypothetical protein